MNKQQLAAKIWESANNMRSKIEANEYKDYILGFIFYKFLCERQTKLLLENDFTKDDIEALNEESDSADFAKETVGYLIAWDNLFDTWLSKGSNFDISNVRDALSAFERLIHPNNKKLYDGIFETLQTGLSKLGDSAQSQTKAVSSLLYLIKDIPMNGKQDYDVLGYIYEYLIGQFASNAGKKAGEFYTPHEVSVLMSEIIAEHCKDKNEITIYDPTSGSGSLLINIGKSIAKHISEEDKIKYYAQELKKNTYNLTRMNLIMRDIKPNNIVTRNADTLEDDWPFFDETDKNATYDPLYVNAVVSNPPYSQPWEPVGKENDARYARYGVAPKTKADYAFLLHDLYHVKPDGIMTIVLPHGVLFRGGEEGNIRERLIEYNNIDAIIGLPANIFFGTGIPTIIIVLRQKRNRDDVLIIDASKGFIKEGKNNKLRECDIKKIVDCIKNRATIEKYSRVVTKDEIRANDYNLNIPRYVDSSEKPDNYDIYASMFGGLPVAEIDDLNEYWETFPNLKKELFSNDGTPYANLLVENVKDFVCNHKDIQSFKEQFKTQFEGFDGYLQKELIENAENIVVAKEQEVLSNEIFARFDKIDLLDKYTAYQLLSDNWKIVEVDLEMIKTEGFMKSTTQVDANLVIKKKNGKDVEVQEGYKGHILPFVLVQETLLKEDLDSLKQKESELSTIPSLYEEILDSLTEDEKQMDFVNEEADSFVFKNIAKAIKSLGKASTTEEKDLHEKLQKVEKLNIKEKSLKATIKKEEAELHAKTKYTIENLSEAQVKNLLDLKWNLPLCKKLYNLTDELVATFIKHIESIQAKYKDTFLDTQNSIKACEQELCSMLNDLTGNDFDMQGLSEFKKLLGGV